MDVSIIIVNYNTLDLTKQCIDSVFEKTKDLEFEVILVDNASTDGSKEYFEHDERIKYIYSWENLGFGRANNVGMMLAKGEYLFLLNSDTLLLNDAVQQFYNYALNHEAKAFYGCWLENAEGQWIHSCRRELPSIRTQLKEQLKLYSNLLNHRKIELEEFFCQDKCTEVGYVTGADMFFHRSVYEETGGFDHNFFLYFEESDWQRTCRKMGIKSYVIHGPRIVHYHGGSQGTKKKVNVASIQRLYHSCCYYIRKDSSRLKYTIFRILNVLLELPIVFLGHSSSRDTIWPRIKVLLKG